MSYAPGNHLHTPRDTAARPLPRVAHRLVPPKVVRAHRYARALTRDLQGALPVSVAHVRTHGTWQRGFTESLAVDDSEEGDGGERGVFGAATVLHYAQGATHRRPPLDLLHDCRESAAPVT